MLLCGGYGGERVMFGTKVGRDWKKKTFQESVCLLVCLSVCVPICVFICVRACASEMFLMLVGLPFCHHCFNSSTSLHIVPNQKKGGEDVGESSRVAVVIAAAAGFEGHTSGQYLLPCLVVE